MALTSEVVFHDANCTLSVVYDDGTRRIDHLLVERTEGHMLRVVILRQSNGNVLFDRTFGPAGTTDEVPVAGNQVWNNSKANRISNLDVLTSSWTP